MKLLGIVSVSAGAIALTASLGLPAATAAPAHAAPAHPAPGPRRALAPTVAQAPRPGQWRQVTATTRDNSLDIGIARGADGVLHVIWTSGGAAGQYSVHDTPIAANATVGHATTIASKYFSGNFADATTTRTGVEAFFNAEQTSAFSTWGTYEATRPLRGGSWHLSSFTTPPNTGWGSGMAATAGSDGKPWLAFLLSGGVSDLHYGHSEQLLPVSGCCFYETGIGTDGRSGATWVTWNSNASPNSGIYYRKVAASGAPSGSAKRAPGSKDTGILLQRMTAVGRGKGRAGVYITYLTGSPFPTAVRLYRLGARTATTAERLGAESTVGISTLSSDPAGRIWVGWASTVGGRSALWVRRSNTAATRLGKVQRVSLPRGTSNVWRVYLSATKSRLDVLALLTVRGKMSYWHTQVLPSR
jgi:hypothetical protein